MRCLFYATVLVTARQMIAVIGEGQHGCIELAGAEQ